MCFHQCTDSEDAVDDERCSQCIRSGELCGPRETTQEFLEWLRSQPPRPQSSLAPRRRRNIAVTANNTPAQNSNEPLRMSSSARHWVTATPVLPETVPTGSNAFLHQSGEVFGTDDNQGGSASRQDILGDFMVPSADPVPDGSLHDTLELETWIGSGIELSPFEELERLNLVRAYIKNQPRMVTQSVSDLFEKHLKDAQRQAFNRMLQESDKAWDADQNRWVYLYLMSALENVDHLERPQIELAIQKITKARQIAGDSGMNPRLRKLICTRHPNWCTEEQNLAILIPRSPENGAILSPSDTEPFGQWFPIPYQIIEFGTPPAWNLFRKIDQLPSVLRTNHLGQNLVHAAAAKGHVGLLQVLSDQGLDIDARDSFGRTPAFIATSSGQDNALEFLYSKGADLSIRTNDTTTLLESAAMGNHVDTIRKLKALHYDFTEKAVRESPLTIAAQNDCYEATYALLQCGADPKFCRHSDWKTAQEIAESKNHPALAYILSSWSR
ncbi:MAG: hypothetical protein Q9225_001888 [Loekoesia sp. 1 TL-2023]